MTRSKPARSRWRVCALLMHPIQYMVPLMRKLAAHPRIDLTVHFMTETGLRAGYLKGLGETLKWDIPLLDGYRHVFLKNFARGDDAGSLLSRINPGIVTALARGRYDALYLGGYVSVTDWLAIAAAKVLRIPVLFHGDVVLNPSAAHPSRGRSFFRPLFCRAIDAALVPSTHAYAFYDRYGVPRDKTYWVPLCVDNEAWMAKADALRGDAADLKKAIGVEPDRPMILHVAQMRPVKRPVDMVRAFGRMKTPASLVMVGSGDLLADVEREVAKIPDRPVHLVGTKNQSELPRYYAAADLFALTSEHEVNPLVIREAMCFRLPLVISDMVQVADDFVRAGENGFTYPMGDCDALAERLDRVLASRETCAAMGEKSRAIIAPWNYDVAVAGIVEALEAVA